MIIKPVAAGIIVISAFIIGRELLDEKRKRMKMYISLSEAVLTLRGCVWGTNMCLPEAFKSLDHGGGGLFMMINDRLESGEGLGRSVEASIHRLCGDYNIAEEERAVFNRIRAILISDDINMFDKGLVSVSEQLFEAAGRLGDEISTKEGLYRKLSVYIALMIIIAIW